MRRRLFRIAQTVGRYARRRVILAVLEAAPPGDLIAAADAARARLAARTTGQPRPWRSSLSERFDLQTRPPRRSPE